MVALSFFSGASALVYQVAWERQLIVVFGNTLLSTATVLAAFMAGLAAGHYVLGRYADRKPGSLLGIFASCQAGIGVYAALLPLGMKPLTPLYVELYAALEGNMLVVNLARSAICLLLIAVPTFLMGGGLPVLAKFLSRLRLQSRCNGIGDLSPLRLGRDVAVLYGANTAGGLLGCCLCGFLLLQVLGIARTTHLAVALNVLTAAVAWTMGRRARTCAGGRETAAPADRPAGPPHRQYPSHTRSLVGAAVFISGFCALAYEVFWARMLHIVLGNTVYSFTLMLSMVLGGIALGSLLYSWLLARAANQLALFFALEAGIGLSACLAPYALHLPPEALPPYLAILLRSAALMAAPTLLMGAALPCAVQICRLGRGREGASVGRAYALNIAGAALGPIAAGFVLMPHLGIQKGLLVLASLNLLAGTIAVYSPSAPRLRRLGAALAWSAVVAGAFALAPAGLFRRLYEKNEPEATIRLYREGVAANVVVYDFHAAGYRDLFLNGSEEASTRLWHVQLFRMLGALPVLVHGGADERSPIPLHRDWSLNALMIAFGAGMSAGACANLVGRLDCVELNPDVGEVADLFRRENLNVLASPGFSLTVNDGRNHLLLDGKTYDVIISDATNPASYDAWTLYTRQFYELCRRRLKPGGVFCQWVPLHLPGDSIRVILNTFRSVFPHASLWSIHGSTQCLMLATPRRLRLDYALLAARAPSVLRASALTECGVDSVEKLLSFFLVGEDNLGRMLDGFATINTDDLPHTQFRRGLDEAGVLSAIDLLKHQESVAAYVANLGPAGPELRRRLRTYRSLSRMLTLGLLYGDDGEFRKAHLLASLAGLGADENVRNALGWDRMRKAFLSRWLADHAGDDAAHASLGYIYHREGDHEAALGQLRRAVAIRGDRPRAHVLMAHVYMETGLLDEAAEKLLELRRLNPTHDTLARFDLSMRVVRLLRKLKYEPDEPRLRWAAARALAEFGWTAKAVEIIGRPPRGAADEVAALLFLAECYESLDLAGKAVEVYRGLARMLPHNAAVARRIAELSEIDRNEESWTRWALGKVPVRKGPSPKPRDEEYQHVLSVWDGRDSHAAVGRAELEHAARDLENILDSGRADAHKYAEAAMLHEALGRFDKAVSLWRKSREASADARDAQDAQENIERLGHLIHLGRRGLSAGERLDVYLALGNLHWKRQEYELATEYYERILDADPRHAVALSNLGMCCVMTGRYQEAIRRIEQSLEHDPQQRYAAEKRQRLRWLYEVTGKSPE